ncbi:MAG: hypothetical protein ABIF04_03545 [Chloroflexota bacterium]
MTNLPFAHLAVNVPGLTGEFDYYLPPELEGKIGLGHLVIVPFGKRIVQRGVFRFIAKPDHATSDNSSMIDLGALSLFRMTVK